jgi:hypothetical protein
MSSPPHDIDAATRAKLWALLCMWGGDQLGEKTNALAAIDRILRRTGARGPTWAA